MAAGIQLPNIPYDAVPPTVAPDSMSAAAGLGFGGTASEERMKAYADRLVASGRYSPSEAAELAYLEEKKAWRDRAKAGPPQTNVDLNLEAAASPMPLDRETTAQRAARFEGYKADDARMAAFETNYNAETGHPEYGYDAAGNAAKLGKVDIRNPSAGQRAGGRGGVGSYADRRRAHWRGANTSELDYQNYPSDYEYDPDGANRPFGGAVDSGPTREEMWAQAEADRLAQNKAEREKYGTGNDREITADQLAARRERTYAEDKMRANPAVEEARIKRLAKAAGISMSEARASYEAGMKGRVEGEPITADALRRGTQGLRDKANDRRLAEQKAARDNWRATAMLAGGSQNINSGNRWVANALVGMKPEEQDTAMRYMLPGGQLHAQVDAANAEAAASMAQRAMTAFLANNPGADPEMAKRAAEQALRKQNPAQAGAGDIAGKNYASPEAGAEFDRLAGDHDTTYTGFSYDDERRLAQTLRNPPYNMPQAEAEAKAYEYAEKRRWISGGRPVGQQAPAAPAGPAGAMPTDGWAPPTSM
jgi:hypothetical protein